MEFKTSFFAIIVVGVLVVALGQIIVAWSDHYNSGIADDYDLGGYDYTSEVQSYVGKYSNGSINPQSGEASSDTESVTFRGAFGIITGIFKPLRIVYSMLDTLFEKFDIPDYLKVAIITMIIASAVFTVVAIVFRQLRENV